MLGLNVPLNVQSVNCRPATQTTYPASWCSGRNIRIDKIIHFFHICEKCGAWRYEIKIRFGYKKCIFYHFHWIIILLLLRFYSEQTICPELSCILRFWVILSDMTHQTILVFQNISTYCTCLWLLMCVHSSYMPPTVGSITEYFPTLLTNKFFACRAFQNEIWRTYKN